MTRSEPTVLGLAVTTTVGYGILYYSFGVLLLPMQRDLHWSKTFLSLGLTIGLLVAAALAIRIGRWLDVHDPLPLFVGGALVTAVALVCWANVHARWQFLLTWLVLGIGQGVLFYDAAFVVLTKRFDAAARRRAITAVTVAGGLASTIFAPLTAALNDHLGWRRTVWVLAALVLVVVVPAASFACRALPRTDASFHWDQLDAASGPVPRQIVRSRQFILLAVAYVLAALTTYAIPVHLVAYLHSRGVSTTSGAFALGAVGIAQVLGRGSFVRVTRGASVVVVATGVFALRAVGIALLVVLPVWVGLVVFVLLYGWSNGVATLTRALTIAELYGPHDYGRLAGVIGAGSGFVGAIAPFLAAGAISLIGDDWVFGALALVALVASGCNELAARHVASHAVA